MAENKTSFILYSDNKSIIDLMSNEDAGLLLKTLFAYVNDENPVIEKSIMLVFEMIKIQLKRDLKKWEKTKEGRSIAGRASAEAKKKLKEIQQNSTNSTNVDFVQQTSTKSTVSDSVSVSVSVSDNKKDIITQNKNVLVDWQKYLKTFNEVTGKQFRVITDKTKSQMQARLKEGYTKEDFLTVIDNILKTEYHKENNYKYLTPEFISRADKMQIYLSANDTKNKNQSKTIEL